MYYSMCFFFNDTATTEIYTLSLHDALPIFPLLQVDTIHVMYIQVLRSYQHTNISNTPKHSRLKAVETAGAVLRSEEHTSELQSRQYLVCRLLLEKKK